MKIRLWLFPPIHFPSSSSHGRVNRLCISRRVISVVTATPPADAIYSEMRMGRCHSIVPAGEDDMDSAPDCTLLYNALSSTSADELLRVINA